MYRNVKNKVGFPSTFEYRDYVFATVFWFVANTNNGEMIYIMLPILGKTITYLQ